MIKSSPALQSAAYHNHAINVSSEISSWREPSAPRLGIVIPLSNEESTVNELLQRVLRQISEVDRVFCVLDNASTDSTRLKVERFGLKDRRVTLVWAPQNRCVVDAYFSGYRAALDAGAQWILEMDGGLSHLPEQIPQFITAMEQGYEYVGGCRFMRNGSHRGAIRRWLISWGGTKLSNLLLGTRMRDMTGGFECFSRAALLHVLNCGVESRAHFFQTEIKYLMRNYKWVEVPINYINPSKSVGMGVLREACRNLWAMYSKSRRRVGGIDQ